MVKHAKKRARRYELRSTGVASQRTQYLVTATGASYCRTSGSSISPFQCRESRTIPLWLTGVCLCVCVCARARGCVCDINRRAIRGHGSSNLLHPSILTPHPPPISAARWTRCSTTSVGARLSTTTAAPPCPTRPPDPSAGAPSPSRRTARAARGPEDQRSPDGAGAGWQLLHHQAGKRIKAEKQARLRREVRAARGGGQQSAPHEGLVVGAAAGRRRAPCAPRTA
jgi:hypothetical protein